MPKNDFDAIAVISVAASSTALQGDRQRHS